MGKKKTTSEKEAQGMHSTIVYHLCTNAQSICEQ